MNNITTGDILGNFNNDSGNKISTLIDMNNAEMNAQLEHLHLRQTQGHVSQQQQQQQQQQAHGHVSQQQAHTHTEHSPNMSAQMTTPDFKHYQDTPSSAHRPKEEPPHRKKEHHAQKPYYGGKTIQQQLDPFYQPYGIDVSHFPLTNPPLFQNLMFDDENYLPSFSTDAETPTSSTPSSTTQRPATNGATQPPITPNTNVGGKEAVAKIVHVKTNTEMFNEQQLQHQTRSRYPFQRRISISNGQIGQLNENVILVDEVYYTQPPPLPSAYNFQHQHSTENEQHQLQHALPIDGKDGNFHAAAKLQNFSFSGGKDVEEINQYNADPLSNIDVKKEPLENGTSNFNHVQTGRATDSAYGKMNSADMDAFKMMYQDSIDSVSGSNIGGTDNPTDEMFDSNNEMIRDSKIFKKTGARRTLPPSTEFAPGTNEWKKARLLERNRIAATRCRQRKKVQQEQFMKEFLDMQYENMDLKKKVKILEHDLENLKGKLMSLVSHRP